MSTNSTSGAPSTAPTSDPLPTSSSIEVPSSSPPLPSSTPTPTSTPTPSSEPPASSISIPTSVLTVSSPPPETTVITQTVAPTTPGGTPIVITVTVVSSRPQSNPGGDQPSTESPTSTGVSDPKLQEIKGGKSTSGLGPSGKTAIAVVVPVVVVALLVLAGIILWRKRKQRKNAEEARRKEVEEYNYNPNHDPTLPGVAMQSEMAEDQSGYRGWGNTTTSSNRQASTTLNSGMAYSDSNSNPGGYTSPGSPTVAGSDGHSVDPLMGGRRETLDSEGIGALGAAPVAGQNQAGVHRGPSNASSSYSAAGHSDSSDNYPLPMNNPQDYYDNNNYYGHSPYDNNGYGGGGQPVIRDVSARRNTRIESPSIFPQQGNSGIAQNF